MSTMAAQTRPDDERIHMLRFPLIVGVVYIHAYAAMVSLAGGSVGVSRVGLVSFAIREAISQGMARVAVPLFFVMSGYLFFVGGPLSASGYVAKLRRRGRTLLLPYLIWNILAFLIFALVELLPATRQYLSADYVSLWSLDTFGLLNEIFGLTKDPMAYQFWFIRDLMLMVLAAPVLDVFLKTAPRTLLAGVLTLWVATGESVHPSLTAVTFFSVGAFLAVRGKGLFVTDGFGLKTAGLYLILLVVDVATKGQWYNGWLHRPEVLLGVGLSLRLSRLPSDMPQTRQVLLWLSKCSFFVFAMHEPALTIVRKLSYAVLKPGSDVELLGLYFLTPLLVIGAGLLAYVLLHARAPGMLRVISGGR